MNALAAPRVGQYLNRHFVSSFQKVATFQINGAQKQGGNVAAYFCTPEGRVLHAVAGPVNAGVLLREARWANETFQMARFKNLHSTGLQDFFRIAHLERLKTEHATTVETEKLPRPDAYTPTLLEEVYDDNACLGLGNQGNVHLFLAVAPMPQLHEIYDVVFAKILNETVSTNPVVVDGR